MQLTVTPFPKAGDRQISVSTSSEISKARLFHPRRRAAFSAGTYEGITNAILVGHSYGGMVITGVADRAAERLAHLVFLDAANPQNGQSLVDVALENMVYCRSTSRVIAGVEFCTWPSADVVEVQGVKDPEDAAWVLERLTPHPWKANAQKLAFRNGDAAWTVPQTQIVCAASAPRREVEKLTALSEGRFWTIDTGHNLMITEPDVVTEMLLRLA